jgi:hypothetical protein
MTNIVLEGGIGVFNSSLNLSANLEFRDAALIMLGVGVEGGVDVPLIFSSFCAIIYALILAMSGNVTLVRSYHASFKLGGGTRFRSRK